MVGIATLNFMNSVKKQTARNLKSVLNYCQLDVKTTREGRKLISGVNCLPSSVYNEMMNTKLQYRKNSGKMFYHLVQSFSPKENITPEKAHELAVEFAEKNFKGYEVLVATHVDVDHIHSHFVLNSVNAETGLKYHADRENLFRLRESSDKLCKKYGLSVIEPKPRKTKPMSPREYRAADKGKSWKIQLAIVISEAMKFARSREHFIELLESEGYEVTWTDTRKHITYTAPNGMKCRDDKLHEEKYLKEVIEREFAIRREINERINGEAEAEYANGSQSSNVRNGYGIELEGVNRSDKYSEYDDRNAEERAVNKGIDRNIRAGYSEANGYDGLGNRQSGREGINSNFEERNDKLYESTAGLPGREHGEQQTRAVEISEFPAGFGEGYGETGWEYERAIYLGYQRGDREAEESDVRINDDIVDSDNILSDMGNYTGYLSASLINIFDNDRPVEDSTTINKKPKKERKNTIQGGPVMGGL